MDLIIFRRQFLHMAQLLLMQMLLVTSLQMQHLARRLLGRLHQLLGWYKSQQRQQLLPIIQYRWRV